MTLFIAEVAPEYEPGDVIGVFDRLGNAFYRIQEHRWRSPCLTVASVGEWELGAERPTRTFAPYLSDEDPTACSECTDQAAAYVQAYGELSGKSLCLKHLGVEL